MKAAAAIRNGGRILLFKNEQEHSSQTNYDLKELIYAVGVIPVFAKNILENCDDEVKPQENAISVKELFGFKESKNFALFIR